VAAACFTSIRARAAGGDPSSPSEVEAGDLIRVPRGTWHWFDLCGDRDIRAIRLFQDKAGWTPHYTNSGTDKGFQPSAWGRVTSHCADRHPRGPAGHRGHDHTHRVRPSGAVPLRARRVHDSLEPRDVAALRAERQSEPPHPDLPAWNAANEPASAEAYVYWLMDRDRKSTALKALQGRIWEAGYRAGDLQGKGEVYPDVRPALARWQKAGKRIAIFSSVVSRRSAICSQTRPMANLSSFFSAYFDTTTGPKREAQSYRQIAATLDRSRVTCCSSRT